MQQLIAISLLSRRFAERLHRGEESPHLRRGESSAGRSGEYLSEQQATAALNAAVSESLPLSDQQDFEDAKRGMIASDPDLRISTAEGKLLWSMPALRFHRGRRTDQRESEPMAPSSLEQHPWVVRGDQRGLPDSRLRPRQHVAHRREDGLDRRRPAHGQRERRKGDGLRARAPRRQARVRHHLHPQPHRSLRRRAWRDLPRRGRGAKGAHHRAGVLPRRGDERERHRRRRDGTAVSVHDGAALAQRGARSRRHGAWKGGRVRHVRPAPAERDHHEDRERK